MSVTEQARADAAIDAYKDRFLSDLDPRKVSDASIDHNVLKTVSHRTTIAPFLFTLTFVTGCSMPHGDPQNPKKNPHPTKRYEVTAMAEAPGPWNSVSGAAIFDIVNLECTRENKFLGVHIKPQDVPIEFEMVRIDEKTWKGHFYRDAILDEDYYGLGICHWDATGVSVVFTAQGIDFTASGLTKFFLQEGPQTRYFKKSAYGDLAFTHYGAPSYSTIDINVAQNPDAYFPITVIVKEETL